MRGVNIMKIKPILFGLLIALSALISEVSAAQWIHTGNSNLYRYGVKPVLQTAEIDKQYVISALTPGALIPNTIRRWNYDSPLGTPVTIYYAFRRIDFDYRVEILHSRLSSSNLVQYEKDASRNFYQYEKDAIVEALTEVENFTNITFVEVVESSASALSSVNILFEVLGGNIVRDGETLSGFSEYPPKNQEDAYGYYITIYPYYRLKEPESFNFIGTIFSEDLAMRYLDPTIDALTYEPDEPDESYNIDYNHGLSYAKSVSYAKWVIRHEIGHALGLYHPFESTRTDAMGDEFIKPILNNEDDHEYNTVMSYSGMEAYYASTSFRRFDVIALQHLYGKNINKNSGSTLYQYDDTYTYHQTIIDADGNDTISVENSQRKNMIDLRGGAFSSISPRYVDCTAVLDDVDDYYEILYLSDTRTDAPNIDGYYIAYCGHIAAEVDRSEAEILEDREEADRSAANYPDGTCIRDVCTYEELRRSYNNLAIDVDTVIENAIGGSDDDIFVANAVANTLMGGDGSDIVMFAGAKADYTIDVIDFHTVIVTSNADSDNSDRLTNIETLHFVADFAQLYNAEIVLLNLAPVITLDQAITVQEGAHVTITATVVDTENDALTYTWTQIMAGESSPVDNTLDNTDTARVMFTAPQLNSANDSSITLTLQLAVSDGTHVVTSQIVVTVIAVEQVVTVQESPQITVTPPTPKVLTAPKKEASGGGSMAWIILSLGALVAFRRKQVK